jgi:predicted SprT family Zn-dependent metalloprotease
MNEAEMLAFLHMEEHGLFDKLWHFDFEACKRTLGRCHYTLKKITLSKWYVELNEEDDVEDTILHEIAHALSWVRYGREGKGHGRLWKRVCREIGATPERIYKGVLEYPDNHHKYMEECCGRTYKKHRLRKDRNYYCPKCKYPLYNKKARREHESAQELLNQIFGKSA